VEKRENNNASMAYFQIELRNALVTSQQWLGSKENAPDTGLEHVELTFEQIRIMDLDTRDSVCWGVATGSTC
jgi:type VI protein secretion system component Hcp